MGVIEELAKKKIALAGLGTEGKSLLSYLNRHAIVPAVLDRASVKLSAQQAVSELITGPDYLKQLTKYDVIFRSPGIPVLLSELVAVHKAGVEISSATKLFFQLCPCPIIGVTGTKGKGTTAALIHAMLRQAGRTAYLGGNIGKSPLDFLDQLASTDLVVLELSSFQLQDLKASPAIAVVTNLNPDHLDYHKSAQEYQAAKEAIVRYQKASDAFILNADDEKLKKFASLTPATKYWFSSKSVCEPGAYLQDESLYLNLGQGEQQLCPASEVKLRGRHNLYNCLAAAVAAGLSGVEASDIARALGKFSGLPHRLEEIANKAGVLYVDDSAATVPEATIAALDSYPQTKVLIAGGSSKQLDFRPLARAIIRLGVRAVVLLGQTGEQIARALAASGFTGKVLAGVKSMKQAVSSAAAEAQGGDVVLLSPASASFGLFTNYQDRGEQFVEAVKNLNEA